MRKLALPLALLIGAASAGLGLLLASGSLLSLFFVLLALAGWAVFGASLRGFNARSAAARERALATRRIEDLSAAGFPELADFVAEGLVDGPTPDSNRRRRVSAAGALRDGSTLVPSAIRPGPLLSAGQPFLVSLGLFGTFFGLSYGLQESIPYIDKSDPDHIELVAEVSKAESQEDGEALAMQVGMSNLLGGAKTAFSKSVAGIGLGLSYMLLWRLGQAAHRKRLEEIGEHVDRFHLYVSSEDLLRESMAELAQEVRGLREAQPDGAALASAGAQLASGAASLSAVAERLGGVSDVLGEFRAETIAREVAAGVRGAVEERLAPTMERISDGLQHLHDMKREQDEAVARQLRALVESLREDALLPIAREVAATNEQTRGVTLVVRELGGTVAESSAAVHAATAQMSELTINLSAFQKDALGQLNEFADKLGESMERQRAAFEASAASATRSFAAQTTALTAAGDVASDAIRRAGTEASETLVTVRTTFGDALRGQQEALQRVLSELEGSFQRDLAERKKFESVTTEAIVKVQKLLLATAVTDTELRQVTIEAANTLGRALGGTEQQIAANSAALAELREGLRDYLRTAHDAHREFLKTEDAHLAEVLGKLYGLVDEVARATHSIHDRVSGGAIDARA